MPPVARATGKRFDDPGAFAGGRRFEALSMFVFETSTRRWAGQMCPDLCASRLNRGQRAGMPTSISSLIR